MTNLTDGGAMTQQAALDLDLAGKAVLLPGASRGIGRAVAEAFARAGAGVVVNGRDGEAVEETVSAITQGGGTALGVVGSAAESAVIDRMVAAAEADLGPIEVLASCAGIAEPARSSILTIDEADWRRLIDIHLTSFFLAARAVAPGMVARGRGSLVATSSHAFTGIYGGTGYAAGKGGVNSLVFALAAELRDCGVRVNAVAPGARTRLSTGAEYEAQINDLHARGLLDELSRDAALDPAPPEYVAPLYVYLGSPLSAPISGEVFVAAGGYVSRFDRPRDQMLAWRDHRASPPWSVQELHGLLSS